MQRKKRWWSVLLLILCGCLCTCPPTPPSKSTSVPPSIPPPPPTSTELGTVELEVDRVWHQHTGESEYELAGSAPLYDDDQVWTDEKGKVLFKFQDIWMRAYWESEQTIKSLGADHTKITQGNGTALYGMSSKGKAKITVQAGHAVIEAIGTIFTVSYVPDEETTLLRTIDGVARMRTQYADGSLGEWREVPANKWSTVVKESDPTPALPVSQMDGIVVQLDIRDVLEAAEEDVITQNFAPPGVSVPAPDAVVPVPASEDGPVTLTLAMPEGEQSDLAETQLARFTQQTGVKVVLVRTGADALAEYTTRAMAGDTDLDVILIDVSHAAMLYDAGTIAPIGERAAEMALDISDFFPGIRQAFTYQGELLALPERIEVPLLYYRSDVLEASGVTPPETYDELISQATILSAEAGLSYGYIWTGKREEVRFGLVEHVAAYGGEIINSDGEVVINSQEAVDGLSQMVTYLEAGASPPEVLDWSTNDLFAVFRDDSAALFMRGWPYAWAELNEAGSPVAGVVGVAPLPQNANSLWCDGFAVWGLSEHPEEAAWLVAFLTGVEQQKERATELGYYPSRNSVYERLPEGWGAFGDQVGVLQQASKAAVPLPTVRAYQEVADILDSGTHLALSGERSAEKAIEIMYDELVSLAP